MTWFDFTTLCLKIIGLRFECPVCGGRFRQMRPFGITPRKNALCPQCFSLERHRLLWLYLKNRTNFFHSPMTVLHIAPEKTLSQKFKQMTHLNYLSIDKASPLAMRAMDICEMSFQDNTFDVILCSHVFEHIPDDLKAMREVFRVLKPGGWAILQVPILREKTFEDPTIIEPADRLKNFGQSDHVRIYGKDYQNRLEKAGFKVTVDGYVRELGKTRILRYGLLRREDIYFCTKNL